MSPVAGAAPALPRAIGMATLLLAAGALAIQAGRRRGAGTVPVSHPVLHRARLAHGRDSSAAASAARGLHGAAAMLAASVLADSAIEHARASFSNPGMVTPLLASSAVVLAGAHGAGTGMPATRSGIYGTALAVGVAGTAFHLYNLLARPGGLAWANLFWGAPLGAPAALSLAGVLGLGAQRTAMRRDDPRSAGRVLCAIVSAGMAGASAEAALLHFRGAYQNPFMWLPVTVPPATALLLGAHAAAPAPGRRRRVASWLRLTAVLGVAGAGFHAWGVHRRMGGWANLRQNLMSGPPLSAPPGFTALALGGLAALALLEHGGDGP